MSLCESLIAQRILLLKNEIDCIELVEWIESFPEIEWTIFGQEPDVIGALVFNYVLKNQILLQTRILETLLKKKTITNEYLKLLLKKNSQTILLQLCVDRFNKSNDQDFQAELIVSPSLQIVFTKKIMLGTKEAFEKEMQEKNE